MAEIDTEPMAGGHREVVFQPVEPVQWPCSWMAELEEAELGREIAAVLLFRRQGQRMGFHIVAASETCRRQGVDRHAGMTIEEAVMDVPAEEGFATVLGEQGKQSAAPGSSSRLS
ncbi:MAG: hypothetical protein R3D25_09700 [Geminicoccaceae bacterium]